MMGYQLNKYGPPSSHILGSLPDLDVQAGQVLIENEAIGLNYPDALMVQGKYQKRPDLPFVPGRDCAGRVMSVGPGVHDFKPGDRVVAQIFSGAFATKVIAPVERVFHRPQGVSAIDGAAAMTVFNTAYVAVAIRAHVQVGQRVIVTGASGGVGAAAVQLAAKMGAHVVAIVSSQKKADLVKNLGAEQAIITTAQDEETLKDIFKKQVRSAWGDERGADIVIDTIGGAMFQAALRALGFAGKLVIVGFASGDIPAPKANYLLYNNLSVMGAPLDIHFDEALADLRAGTLWWLDLLAKGEIETNIAGILPFENLMQGLQDILDRKASGKLVVSLKERK